MFRLIKLAGYCVAGYVLYEFWRGMSEGAGRLRGASMLGEMRRDESDLDRALNEGAGRMMNMTGAGRGTTVSTEEPATGQSVPHVVGRGVVSR